MKKFNWKDYFVFSKNERIIALVFVVIFIAIMLVPYWLKQKQKNAVTTSFREELTDSFVNISAEREGVFFAKSSSKKHNIVKEINTAQLFVFDPNTLDQAGWVQLGLPTKNIQTILHYRNKGGRFFKPADIRKIYGLSKTNAEKLIPFIHITTNRKSNYKSPKYVYRSDTATHIKRRAPKPIYINTATVEDWKSLPGIGEVLSHRIVKFRNARGGFQSIEEVSQTYGLKDSVFQMIKPLLIHAKDTTVTALKKTISATSPTLKINLNKATEQEMKQSHIFSTSIIKAILIYRHQHHGFKSVEELKNIPFISQDTYLRLAPHLTIE